jgi:VanZ family protein
VIYNDLNVRFFWSATMWTYLVLLFVLGLAPADQVSLGSFNQISHSDKVAHFIAYAGLGFLFHQILDHTPKALLLRAVLVGVIIEILQTQVPTRSFELADILANILGAVSGMILSGRVFPRFAVLTDKFLTQSVFPK